MGFFGFGKRKKKGAAAAIKREEERKSTAFLVFGEDEHRKPAIVVKAKPRPSAASSDFRNKQPPEPLTNYNDRKSVGASLAASAANIVQLRKSQKVKKPFATHSDDEASDSDTDDTKEEAKAPEADTESVGSDSRRVPIASARLAVTSLATRPTVPRGARRAPTMSRQFQGNLAKGLLANVSAEDLAYAKKKAEEAKLKAEESDKNESDSDDKKETAKDDSTSTEEEKKKAKEMADTSPLRMNLTLDRKRAERKKSGNSVHPLSVRIKAGYEFFERDGTTYRVRSGWRKSLSRSTTFDGYGVYLMKTERDWELVRDPILKTELLSELRAVRPGRSSSAGRLSLHHRGSGASSSMIRDRTSRKMSAGTIRSNSIVAAAEVAYRAKKDMEKHSRSRTAGAVMSTGPDGETVREDIISFDNDSTGSDDDESDGGKNANESESSMVSVQPSPKKEQEQEEEKEIEEPKLMREKMKEEKSRKEEDEGVEKKKKKKKKKKPADEGDSESNLVKKKKKKKKKVSEEEDEGYSEIKKKKKKKKKVPRDRQESSASVESGDWIVTVKRTAPEPQSWPGSPPDLMNMQRRKSVRDLAAMFNH